MEGTSMVASNATCQRTGQKEEVVTIFFFSLKSILDSHCYEEKHRHRTQMEPMLDPHKCHHHRVRAQAPAHVNKAQAASSSPRWKEISLLQAGGLGREQIAALLLAPVNSARLVLGPEAAANCSQASSAKPPAASPKAASMTSRSPPSPVSFQVASGINEGLLLCGNFCLFGWNVFLCVLVTRCKP